MKSLITLLVFMSIPTYIQAQCNHSYGEWDTQLPLLDSARSSFSAVSYNDSIYCFGGISDISEPDYYKRVDVYVPATKTWVFGISEMPLPRGCSNACLIGHKVYLPGGIHLVEGSPAMFNNLDIYDISTNSWEQGKELPTALSYFGADTINGKIYLAGGGTDGWNMKQYLFVYDPALDEWTEKASLNEPRWANCAKSINGKLYVFGGYTGSNWRVSNTIEVYDPALDQWDYLSEAFTPRAAMSAACIDDQLYIFGGFHGYSGSDYHHTSYISRYSPATDHWFDFNHSGDDLPGSRRFPASTVVKNSVYLFGGGSEVGLEAAVWAFQLKDLVQAGSIGDFHLETGSAETDLADFFSGDKGNIIYDLCPGYDQELISASIENTLLTLNWL